MRTLTPSTVALTLVLAGTSLLAQPANRARSLGPGRALKEQLQLTDQQINQIKEIRRQQFQALQPQREQVRSAARSLREMVQADNPDPSGIGNQVLALKKLRAGMQAAREDWNKRALAVLTPEQAAKLKELREAARKSRAARGARAFGLLDPMEPRQRQ